MTFAILCQSITALFASQSFLFVYEETVPGVWRSNGALAPLSCRLVTGNERMPNGDTG